MKFNISNSLEPYVQEVLIGNVYNVRGGHGAKKGYMMVVISIVESTCTVLTINKEGEIVSASNYGTHYFEDKCPMAFCKTIEALNFDVDTIC